MSEENLKVAVLEKQILRCLLEHNELLDKNCDVAFISPQANEFYLDLLTLRKQNKKIIAENILTLDNEYLTSDLVIAVQETEYSVDEFDDYVDKLSTKSMIHEFKSDVLTDLNENSSDFEKLEDIKDRINELEEKISSKNNDASSFTSLIREYKDEIKKRASGIRNTTGDYNLDKILGGFEAGIVALLGMSGSMKSTLTIKILRNRITKRLPTCAINTELTHAVYMDTMVSTMIDEDYNNLRGYNSDEDNYQDWDSILQKLDELEKVYDKQEKKRKLFDFYPSNSVSVADIKLFCKKCRKDFRLKKDETLFCTIDLALMIKDIKMAKVSQADAITFVMDELNEFALSENVLFFMTFQAKRKPHGININKLEDLNEFRLRTEDIKSASGIEERSRVILSLHNPKYLVEKNPCSQIIRDLVDPILELTVIKNSWKENLGQTIYYYIDSEHKDLIDYVPQDGEILNSGNTELNSNDEETDDITSRLEKQLEED